METTQSYRFPLGKLKQTLDDGSKIPLVLLACGSFSPITTRHTEMFEEAAAYIRTSTQYELVGGYVSPVGDAYKKKGLAKAQDRINMCELAVQGVAGVMVDPWEALHDEYTVTALVLDHLKDELNAIGVTTLDGQEQEIQVSLLAGADLIETMSTPGVWSEEDISYIMRFYGAFIVPRLGTDVEDALRILQPWRENIRIIPLPSHNNRSSTRVRALLAKKQSIEGLVAPGVEDYIHRHDLYSSPA